MNSNSSKPQLELCFPTRAPGKRQIKPVAREKMNDIYKLLQEESDASDSTCRGISESSDESNQSFPQPVPETIPEKQVPENIPESRDVPPTCMICLSYSKEEVVVCDCCGVSVHEECYGITDNDSQWDDMSVESAVSTEPWFCTACLLGNYAPTCALCPNSGGAFKKTLCGQWVHLICALVVQGVTFEETDGVNGISLMEIPYCNYGHRKCVLCLDWRYASTGVAIQCDCGLCRAYFHTSCSLMHGYLCNNYSESVDDGGAYYSVYCAQHSVPEDVARRRRNWTNATTSVAKSKDKIRSYSSHHIRHNERVLKGMKSRYQQMQWTLNKSYSVKGLVGIFSRDLVTSKSALSRLVKKAELMNITTSINVHDFDISKLWYIPPGFTPAFMYYYLDRDKRTEEMKSTLAVLREKNQTLRLEEEGRILSFEQAKVRLEGIGGPMTRLENMYACLSSITAKKLRVPMDSEGVIRPVVGGQIEECVICCSREQQHLMVKCGVCHRSQHIHCLSPPLLTVPRITMGYAWRCCLCDVTVYSKIGKESSGRIRRAVSFPMPFLPKAKKVYTKKTAKGIPVKTKRKYTKRVKKESIKAQKRGMPEPDLKEMTCSLCGTVSSMGTVHESCNDSSEWRCGKCTPKRKYKKKESVQSGEYSHAMSDLVYTNVTTKSGRMTRQVSWSEPAVVKEVDPPKIALKVHSSLFSSDLYESSTSLWIGTCYYCAQSISMTDLFIRCRSCFNIVHRRCPLAGALHRTGHDWNCPECS